MNLGSSPLCPSTFLWHFSSSFGVEVTPRLGSLTLSQTGCWSPICCLSIAQTVVRNGLAEKAWFKDTLGFWEQYYFMCFQNTLFCLQIYGMAFITSIKYLKQKEERKPEVISLHFSGASPWANTLQSHLCRDPRGLDGHKIEELCKSILQTEALFNKWSLGDREKKGKTWSNSIIRILFSLLLFIDTLQCVCTLLFCCNQNSPQ